MTAPARIAYSVACASLLLVGCGGESADPQGTGGAGGQGAGGAGAQGGAGGSAACAGAAPTSSAICVQEVTGTVLDEQAAPLADLLVTVCGSISCTPATTGPDGAFAVVVDDFITLADYSVLPHGRERDLAGFYFALPAGAPGPEVDAGALAVLDMPSQGPVLVVKTDQAGAPAQSVSSAEVTLEVPEGVEVQLAFEDVTLGEAGAQFRVRQVPEAIRDDYAEASLQLTSLFALYPFEASFRPEGAPAELAQARLSFPNSAGLAAGVAVEVLALGSFVFPDWVTPAHFEVVASAQVTADGQRIEMDPGEGVAHLTWLGLRLAP